jgi:serine/threonine protein kinase
MAAINAQKPPTLPNGGGSRPADLFDGKYLLIRELGAGAAGTVHEAEHLIVGKKVAIKILHAELVRNETLRSRFVAEARAAAQIGHPNVVDIYDFGITSRGVPYIVMELLEGETLEQLLARREVLPPAYACELTVQLLSGLGAAHSMGIVHRDLKPANVIVTHPRPDSPLVKILDFGIAQGVHDPNGEEGLIGTPVYMAPEQALGKPVDARADLYSLGVMLYEMLAGEAPFSGSAADVLKRVVVGQWKPLANVNPAVPRLLGLAVSVAMATEPTRRVQSAHAFAAQLTQYLSHPPPHSVQQGPRSADAFLLSAGTRPPEIRMISDAPEAHRPSRDFPALGLAKIAGRPRGEPLADSLLQSPIIPRAPSAPKIQLHPGIREVERWSDAPAPLPEGEEEEEEPEPAAVQPRETTAKAADPVFDVPSSRHYVNESEPPAKPPWKRAAVAAAVGMGLGAVLAWIYQMS